MRAGRPPAVRTGRASPISVGFRVASTRGHPRGERHGVDGRPSARDQHAADLHLDRRRPLQPHLPGRGRRGAGLGPAPAAAAPRTADGARHVPRAPADARARPGRDPRPGHDRPVHRRSGQRAPLLRDGIRRGPHLAQRTRGGGRLRRGDTARRRRPHGRHPGRSARRRSRRDRTRRPRSARGLHRAAAQALARAVRADAGRGRRPRRTGGARERRAVPAHPQAATDLGGTRGLPHGQRRARRRRVGAGHPRLGDLHARRPPRRRGAPDGLLGRPERHHGRARTLPHDGAGVLDEGGRPRSLRVGLGSRPLRGRLLRRLRLLEAGLHPPGRLRALRGRRGAGDQGSVESFPAQIGRLFEMAAESLESVQ